jgi:mannose-6-phosphate isomerase-like protein (cupin superfamily)
MTPSSTEDILKEAIRTVFGLCPDEFVEAFLLGYSTPTQELIAEAETTLLKPYGSNHILCSSGSFGLSFVCMDPNRSTSLHVHASRREFFAVRCGVLTLTSGDKRFQIERGGFGSSVPGIRHQLKNNGAAPLEILEIFAPPHLDDKVRVEDPYGRKIGPVTREQ